MLLILLIVVLLEAAFFVLQHLLFPEAAAVVSSSKIKIMSFCYYARYSRARGAKKNRERPVVQLLDCLIFSTHGSTACV